MHFIYQFIAKIILIIHLLCLLFVVFGFLLPNDYLSIHLYAIPLMILQWWVNNNQCVLTQIQQRLEGKPMDPQAEGQFIKDLLSQFGLKLERGQLFKLVYGVIALSFGLSCLRYFLSL